MNDTRVTQIINEIEMRERAGQKTIWIWLNMCFSSFFFRSRRHRHRYPC